MASFGRRQPSRIGRPALRDAVKLVASQDRAARSDRWPRTRLLLLAAALVSYREAGIHLACIGPVEHDPLEIGTTDMSPLKIHIVPSG